MSFDWKLLVPAVVLALIVREICVYLGVPPLRRDEAALTVIVFAVLLLEFRSLWYRARFWLAIAGLLAAHAAMLWLLFDVLVKTGRVVGSTMLLVGVIEASLAAYFLGIFRYNDQHGIH